jgi:lauroyl/myristoyl acyltransferase
MFDKTLFFFLSDRAFKTWIMEYFIIENSEQLSMLQNRQIIFCAFHFANYEMLPIVLGAHGIEVYTPIAFKDELFKKHTNRIEEVKERIFPVVPRIYSRTNKDGIILFRALKNNKNILLYCDTHILLTDIYAKVKMFGHEVKVSRGAGVLHKKTGIPIVPILTHLKND